MTAPGAWAADPPEINSAGFWLGPGASSFMASAAELSALAGAIIAMLGGDEAVAAALGFAWPAPTGELAVLANVPHLLWQAASALQLLEHAGKIEATAGAFETLKAATPTPVEVETNQVTHGALQATNFLGINTPAIIANRGQYFGDYWVRAASNKYSYAAASAAGVQAIEPLMPPTSVANPMGGADQGSSQAAGSDVMQPMMQMMQMPMQMLGQMGGQFGQVAGMGQQFMQPLMSMSSGMGAGGGGGAGALDGAGAGGSWASGAAASVGGPVSASLSAGGGVGGMSGAALAPLRGPVSWASSTTPVGAQSAAPAAGLGASAGTAPAGIGGGAGMGGAGMGGAMMAAGRAGSDDDKRDAEHSAAILGSIANFYREPMAVPVITGHSGALLGRGSGET